MANVVDAPINRLQSVVALATRKLLTIAWMNDDS